MAGFLQPLDQKFPVVNTDGTPTDYFTRWAQQRMDDIVAAATADQVSAAIDTWAAARLINTASPILGGGSLANDLNLSHAASGVTAGTYGDATNVAQITVDDEGHVTDVVEVPISGGGGGGGTVTTTGAPATGSLAIFSGPTSITDGDLSGDVSTSGDLVVTIGAHKVTRGMLAATAGATILGSTGAGNVADLTAAQAKTFLAIVAADVGGLGYFATGTNAANLTGTVAAAQLPAMTGGDVTSPAGSAVLTIGPATITLAKMANLPASTIIGNNTGGAATPLALTVAQVKTLLAIAAGDVSGLNYFATGTDASNLTGTLAAARIAAASLTYGKIQNEAATTLLGNPTGLPAAPSEVTLGGGNYFSGTVMYGAINHPGYITGNYYWTLPGVTVAAGTTFTANNIKLMPFVISKPITVAELAARVTTTSAGNSFQLALYASNAATGRPTGNALCSTGNLSTTTAAMVSGAAVSSLLNPGLYWMGVNQNNGVAAYLTTTSPVMGYLIGSATLANLNLSTTSNALCLSVSQAFGSWPDLTSASFVEQTTLVSAMVAMKAA